jgi:hypothetical protein
MAMFAMVQPGGRRKASRTSHADELRALLTALAFLAQCRRAFGDKSFDGHGRATRTSPACVDGGMLGGSEQFGLASVGTVEHAKDSLAFVLLVPDEPGV